MGIYNVSAGHGLPGGKGCGAVSLLDESAEARKVKDELIRLLRFYGSGANDCTFEGNDSSSNILSVVAKRHNEKAADLDIQIHLNGGRNDKTGDGKSAGVEVYGYSMKMEKIGTRVCEKISGTLGIGNRGFKLRPTLYFLRKTIKPAILIECCFVDDADDVRKWDPKLCASAIAQALFEVVG